MSKTCSQCGQRPAIAQLEEDHLLCLECWGRVEKIVESRHRRALDYAALSDYMSQEARHIVGFGPPPVLDLPKHPSSPTIQTGPSTLNNFSIQGSTIGLLNVGEIAHVRAIDASITQLTESGNEEVAKAIQKMTEAILGADQNDLRSDERKLLLDQLEELTTQASRETGSRSPGVIRALIGSLGSTLQSAGGLAEVWATWGTTLRQHFGL